MYIMQGNIYYGIQIEFSVDITYAFHVSSIANKHIWL